MRYAEIIAEDTDIDPSLYGGFIKADGEVLQGTGKYVHYDILKQHGIIGYHGAWKAGWVRFISRRPTLYLEGKREDIGRCIKIWLPVAQESEWVMIDFITDNAYGLSKVYIMPQDRVRMLYDVRGRHSLIGTDPPPPAAD